MISKRVAACALMMLTLFGCSERRALSACDYAIKQTLRDPDSYKRLSNGRVITSTGGPFDVTIRYQATNIAGSPIASGGYCLYDPNDGHADWHELRALTP